MQIFACLLTGLAAAAQVVPGWLLLAGLLLAGVLAAVVVLRTGAARGVPVDPRLRAVGWLLLGALAAQAFGRYVIPGHPWLTAGIVVVLAAVAALAAAARVEQSATSRRLFAGVLLLAAAGFVAVCFGIEPPPHAEPPESAGAGPLGVLAVAGLFAAPLLVREPAGSRRSALVRVVAATVAALAVAAGALYQLGPARLRLSDVPLRDTLIAADAQTLTTMLAAAVVVGVLPAVFTALAAAQRGLPGSGPLKPLAVGGAVALAAAFAPAAVLLAAASAVSVTGVLLGRRRRAVDVNET